MVNWRGYKLVFLIAVGSDDLLSIKESVSVDYR